MSKFLRGTSLSGFDTCTLMGFDFIIQVEFRMIHKPRDATWDTPAEGAEWETDSITLFKDEPGMTGPSFEVTGALFDVLAEYMRDGIEYACYDYEPYWEY
jgi:hypothetical protein